MPSSIQRVCDLAPGSEHDWQSLLKRKVGLVGWVAIHRRNGLADLQKGLEAVKERLGLKNPYMLVREDVALRDDDLLKEIASAREDCEGVFDLGAWEEDAQFALRRWSEGAYKAHREDYVAVYRLAELEFGNDANELRRKWSRIKKVAYQRIVVQHIGLEEEFCV